MTTNSHRTYIIIPTNYLTHLFAPCLRIGRLLAVLLSTIIVLHGYATYYSPGVFDEVIANRLAWGQIPDCPECVGYAALIGPEHIGRRAWVGIADRWRGPLLIVDCAQIRDKERLLGLGWVVDVDYQTAEYLGFVGDVAEVIVVVY